MSHWNHRVVRRTYQPRIAGHEAETFYEIHEAYYNDEGKCQSVTMDAVYPVGETLDELKEEIERMLWATLQKPVLDYETLEEL